MKNKSVLIVVISLLIGGGIGFFSGKYYQQSQKRSFIGEFTNQRLNQQGSLNNRGGFRPVGGEIISNDEKSITVKLQDESSKIILINSKTQINRAEVGEIKDLKVGEKVSVFGSENTDGSITANNIQLNPVLNNNYLKQ